MKCSNLPARGLSSSEQETPLPEESTKHRYTLLIKIMLQIQYKYNIWPVKELRMLLFKRP